MNVSSVKNLNGETFSAVQDATLTDVVQTNSGKWNEISAYELASANYLTAHQDISNLMPKSESANFYPMTGNPSGFLNTLPEEEEIEFEEINLSSFATPVSNSGDLYKLEFDGVDLYGYKSNTNIPNYVYSAVSSSDVNYSFNNVSPDPDFDDNEPFYYDLYNWSAFDIISISSNVGQIMPASSQGEDDVTAVDVYYNASYLYDYNNNQLADFSGYIGKITLDNLVISSYFDKPSYYDNIFRGELNLWFSSNLDFELYLGNEYICSVGNKVQSGTDTLEGIFVPTSAQLLPYPMAFVSTSSEATGTNILYVVTGTGE